MLPSFKLLLFGRVIDKAIRGHKNIPRCVWDLVTSGYPVPSVERPCGGWLTTLPNACMASVFGGDGESAVRLSLVRRLVTACME